MRSAITVEQTQGDMCAPAFVIPLRKDSRMECGKTYEATIVPRFGEISLGDINTEAVSAAVSSVTGCRAVDLRATPGGCVVRWRCHDSCPHVGKSTAWSVAYVIADALSRPGVEMKAETCGMVWIQSNWLYLAGGVALAGIGALGASLLHRRLKR